MDYKVEKEFILQAHKEACAGWKIKLEKKFPKVFEKQNGWYKDGEGEDNAWLMYFEDGIGKFGFNANGKWRENVDIVLKNCCNGNTVLASKEEVRKRLEKEAIKRGFVKGVRWRKPRGDKATADGVFGYEYKFYHRSLDSLQFDGKWVLYNGVWGEILSNPKQDKIAEIEKTIEELKQKVEELKN